MVPLYAARIEDIGPGDYVRMTCAACGHDASISPSSLLDEPRLPPGTACSILNNGCAAANAR